MGSKARHARHILPIVLAGQRFGQLYVEPFMGGANTFHLVRGPKWGNDLNADVVAMFAAVAQGWTPPEDVSEADYEAARAMASPSALRGFIGVGASYSGKFFGGYARGDDARGVPRNYARESQRNLLAQVPGLRGARFTSMPYDAMVIPDGAVVYCDPPYAGTTRYAAGAFDSISFHCWCERLAQRATVFVSEYAAPASWELMWSARVTSSLTKDTGSKQATECLFKVPG